MLARARLLRAARNARHYTEIPIAEYMAALARCDARTLQGANDAS